MSIMTDTIGVDRPGSGRFLLRISPGLHAVLRSAAAGAGVSLNEHCARKLAAPGTPEGPVFEIVQRATAQFGVGLMGIVAFGSWARGEASDQSDVDLLLVVGPEVAIVRRLYRPWDEAPLVWEGRPVEVHIVHLPELADPPLGLWSEAALEGVVLFERGLELSRRLVGLRRRIAAGDVSRRYANGVPYWVSAT